MSGGYCNKCGERVSFADWNTCRSNECPEALVEYVDAPVNTERCYYCGKMKTKAKACSCGRTTPRKEPTGPKKVRAPKRPCFVYVKTPSSMALLQKGDIFSLGPAMPGDNVDAGQLYIALSSPQKVDHCGGIAIDTVKLERERVRGST